MNPPVLMDSDVLVDFLRGNPKAVAFVTDHSTRIVLSSIVCAELYAGVKNDQELDRLNGLLSLFRVVPVTFEIARTGGLYKREYGKSHGVGLADAIIAATAEAERAVLKTLNTKHYPMISGLRPAYIKG